MLLVKARYLDGQLFVLALKLYFQRTQCVFNYYSQSHKYTYIRIHVKCLLFGSNFNHNRNVSKSFSENRKYKILQKYSLWQSRCFMRSQRPTDANRPVVAFCFSNAPICPSLPGIETPPPPSFFLFRCFAVGFVENWNLGSTYPFLVFERSRIQS